jgi:hypothetical protein
VELPTETVRAAIGEAIRQVDAPAGASMVAPPPASDQRHGISGPAPVVSATTPAGHSNTERWVPYDDELIQLYLGPEPGSYKGRLSKLVHRRPELRRDATSEERARFPRVHYLYNPRILYELTEGASR